MELKDVVLYVRSLHDTVPAGIHSMELKGSAGLTPYSSIKLANENPFNGIERRTLGSPQTPGTNQQPESIQWN